jgi:hypothetical protein
MCAMISALACARSKYAFTFAMVLRRRHILPVLYSRCCHRQKVRPTPICPVSVIRFLFRSSCQREQRSISSRFKAQVLLGGANQALGAVLCTRRKHNCQFGRLFSLPWCVQFKPVPVSRAPSRWNEAHYICVPKSISHHVISKRH